MDYPTYADILARVEDEMDTLDEDFVSASEVLGFANRAVDQCESKIHQICEDIYLTKAYLALTAGSPIVALPTNIYNNRVRALLYKNGNYIYQLEEFQGENLFLEDEVRNVSPNATEEYRYLIKNDSASVKPYIYLSPVAQETILAADQRFVCWYIRNANKFTTGTDICDIPEGADFIVEYMKKSVAEKEKDFEAAAAYGQNLLALENDLISMLNQRADSRRGKIKPDTSWYYDHV